MFVFPGEFDQPETIWSNEMRRLMIEKIAVHIGKYSSLPTRKNLIFLNFSRLFSTFDVECFGYLFLLYHSNYQLSSIGRRIILQYLLPSSSMRRTEISRMAYSRTDCSTKRLSQSLESRIGEESK